MKKLLFAALFACAALFTSCTTNEGTGTEEIAGSYTGTLTISDVDGNVSYTQEDTVFDFEANDGFGEMVMNSVKFSAYMPVTLTITASDIPFVSSGVYEIASVIPTVGGAPMEAYTLTNVAISASDSSLAVEFECYGSYAKFVSK
ncbi:MAG: hypothetical protein SNJ33_06730 [Rikenellaceae bacterium]